MRTRRGFTLVELLVVLVILSIMSAAALPAFTAARHDPEADASDALVALLTQARDRAREQGISVELVIAPRDARYWLSDGTHVEVGMLTLAPSQHLVAANSERVTCRFRANGPATPCAIALRGARDVIVRVDPWSGAVATRSTP